VYITPSFKEGKMVRKEAIYNRRVTFSVDINTEQAMEYLRSKSKNISLIVRTALREEAKKEGYLEGGVVW
jgi:hypothetical protein